MEMTSTHTRLLIEVLLSVHALSNMYRSSENKEYMRSAAEWLPRIHNLVDNIEHELSPFKKENTK